MHKPKLTLVAQTPAEALADELINITAKLREFEVDAMNKRVTAIKGELQSIAENFPANQPMTIKGTLGIVELTACSETTKVNDMEGLLEYADQKIGHEALMSVIKVTLTDLKKVLSQGEIDKFSEKVQGSRSCKVMVINAPNAATVSA